MNAEEYYEYFLDPRLTEAKSWHDREEPYDSALSDACDELVKRDLRIQDLESALNWYKHIRKNSEMETILPSEPTCDTVNK